MREGIDCRGDKWEERELCGKMLDISDKRFCDLTAMFPVNSKNQKKWLCKCKCGNEIAVTYGGLSSNNTRSCGCLQKQTMSKLWDKYRSDQNYIGQRFGRLTVIEFVDIRQNAAVYKFRCDCGNIVETFLHDVKEGNTKSCGCLKRDHMDSYKTDIIGEKFGHLFVQSYVGTNKHGTNVFQCLCDCGEIVEVSRNSLTTGHTQSCGCLRSVGENNIKNILNHTILEYKQQYAFADLLSDAGRQLPYDFAIFNHSGQIERLVEFDGNQHVQPYDFFGGEEKFMKVKRNDMLKNQYAISHNISLVRIPYSKRDTVCIDDILGSKYLYSNI